MGVITLAGFIATMVVAPMSFADVAWIPGSIKVEQFKEEMMARGMDLSGTDDADGLVENQGTRLKVVTYGELTMEQLNDLKEAATKSLRLNG